MPYTKPVILTEKAWNNAFAWEKRTEKYNHSPTLSIPMCITGDISHVQVGNEIAFEEVEDGILKSCTGLRNFVQLSENTIIFDNHNHALYFWIDALRKWIITPGFELIHIDEHSDLWENDCELDLEKAKQNPDYAWDFTNLSCNVGNYILPAIDAGLINNVLRIENEYQIDTYIDYSPLENSVLNLDLDIFNPELDHIPEKKKIQIIRNLIPKVKYVTIATSPYFIDQWKSIQMLQKIFQRNG